MATKSSRYHQSHEDRGSAPGKASRKVVIGKATDGGREIWYLASDGRRETIITSVNSARALNEGLVKFDRALRRLADR